jgi:hypothetical protein
MLLSRARIDRYLQLIRSSENGGDVSNTLAPFKTAYLKLPKHPQNLFRVVHFFIQTFSTVSSDEHGGPGALTFKKG